jgi:ubiquitin carboxyl-terminal hydrolase 8
MSGNYKEDLKKNIINLLTKKIKKKNVIIDESQEIVVHHKTFRHKFKKSLSYLTRNIVLTYWGINCSIKPEKLKSKISMINPRFIGSTQNDSEEVINLILETIHEECKKNVKVVINFPDDNEIIRNALSFLKNYLEKNYSIITNIFTGLFLMEHSCSECKNISYAYEPYNMISLPIPEKTTTLEDCLTQFTTEEILSGDNKYYCDKCKKKVDGTKLLSFWKLPPRLIIQLKRYHNNKNILYENKTIIVFPICNLDLTPYFCKYNPTSVKYDLYGVIQQFGGIRGGHYIAYTKNLINNEWYKYDDDIVTHIHSEFLERELINGNSYILFYKMNL